MSLLCQSEAIPAMYQPGVVPPVRDATRFPSQNATRDVVPTNPRYSHSPKRLGGQIILNPLQEKSSLAAQLPKCPPHSPL